MTSTRILYDPKDQATINDPLPIFRRLQESDPCHWCKPLRSWVFTRYDDVREVLNDNKISSDRLTPYYRTLPEGQRQKIGDLIRYLNTWVAFKDPPEHTRMRALLNKVLTPGAVRDLQPAVERAVHELLDKVAAKREFDFTQELAYPLPATVILMMLGLPPDDMQRLRDWSTQMQSFIGSATASPDKHARAQEGAVAMADYFRAAIKERTDRPRDDMLTKLVACREGDDALSEDEIIGTAMLFLFGGHETTTNLIGNGVRALMQHPEQLERLRDQPSKIRRAIEEILRFDGPTLATVRVVGAEHTRHGRTLEKGQRVFVMVHGANHDPRKFDQPEVFDIGREPNPHLTFNYGPHFCLGAALARMEGEVAIGAVIERLPNLTLSQPRYDYMDTMVMRGVRTMPVRQEI